MTKPEDASPVPDAIRNPNDPSHFMRVVPAGGTCTASISGREIARSDRALVVNEVGRAVYDPVVYFPRSDVNESVLIAIDKTTHCPLKGNTAYFDLVVDDQRVSEAAWSYTDTIEAAEILTGLIAFDRKHVTVSG